LKSPENESFSGLLLFVIRLAEWHQFANAYNCLTNSFTSAMV
jgi:hypothetical protein